MSTSCNSSGITLDMEFFGTITQWNSEDIYSMHPSLSPGYEATYVLMSISWATGYVKYTNNGMY